MWTMGETSPAGNLSIDFTANQAIGSLHIWNYNQGGSANRSANNVQFQTSTDGLNWTDYAGTVTIGGTPYAGNNITFPIAPAANGYAGFAAALSTPISTRYFQLKINNTYGGNLTLGCRRCSSSHSRSSATIRFPTPLQSRSRTPRCSSTGSETIRGLGGFGNVQTTATSTLTTGGNNANTTFSGVIQNGSGTMSFTKTGTGTMTLKGAIPTAAPRRSRPGPATDPDRQAYQITTNTTPNQNYGGSLGYDFTVNAGKTVTVRAARVLRCQCERVVAGNSV